MRILFLSSEFPGPHDPLRAVFNLRMCEALATSHAVRVVSPVAWTERWKRGRPADAGSALSTSAVSYATYYFPPRMLHSERGTFMWWSLRRHLLDVAATWQPDAIFSYWAYPDGEAALRLARRLGVPVVQIVGGSDVLLARPGTRRLERVRHVLTSADAVVAIGQHLARAIVDLGVAPERVYPVYRPVDPNLFSPGSRTQARAALGLPELSPIAVWAGRFVPVKGLDVLVRALDAVRRREPRVLLVMIGEGPEMSRIQELVDALDLASHVRFVGPVSPDALGAWYRAADLFVLPSISEGVPNVLLEAKACGLPFAASAVGGIPEIAEPELDRLVPPGDAEALARAVTELIAERARRVPRRASPASPQQFVRQLESIAEGAMRSSLTRRAAS